LRKACFSETVSTKEARMRIRIVLAIILLAVGLCFVPGVGHGEIEEWMDEIEASYIDVRFLQATVSYMMTNPTSFSNVSFRYDLSRLPYGSALPADTDLKGKIYMMICDNRGSFARFSGIALRDVFKTKLTAIYSFIGDVATDMDTDVVAEFRSEADNPLGYFYQGEYHLWGE